MKVGQAIQNLMKREGIDGEQMAMDLCLDSTMISKMKHNHRNMQEDIATRSIDIYDNPLYTMEVTRQFTKGNSAPVIDGKAVDDGNILALMVNAKKEIDEAEEAMQLEKFLRNPKDATDKDRELAKQTYLESLEAAFAIENFCARLVEAYELSAKELNQALTQKWKATEVMK